VWKPLWNPRTDARGVAKFWNWWSSSGSKGFETAIAAGGDFGDLPAICSSQLDVVHPNLQWELSPGQFAEHALCITSGGVAELRPLAERMIKGAPPAHRVWEYRSARVADPAALDASVRGA
jgi:hypothetical protein